MFVHKDFQRIGIAKTLFNEMELYARTRRIKKLTSEVSITAINFFQKNRYIIVKEQKRKANKMFLTNYLVEKYHCCPVKIAKYHLSSNSRNTVLDIQALI